MARADSRHAEGDLCLGVVEDVLRAAERAEEVRRQAENAQRSAADSFDRSADSHDRVAGSYEQLARPGWDYEEYLERAAVHREFAQEDREIAQLLRQLVDGASMGGS